MRTTHWKKGKGDTVAVCHTDKRPVSLFTALHTEDKDKVKCQHCKAEMRRQGLLPEQVKSKRGFRR